MLPLFLFFILMIINIKSESNKKDLTIIGSVDFKGSVHRHSIGLIDCLKDKIKINFIVTRKNQFKIAGVSDPIKDIILTKFDEAGAVSILVDPIWALERQHIEAFKKSKIKIAYAVHESTVVPLEWVNQFNNLFDAIVVADSYFIDIYKKSGVKKPIFSLPLGIYIDEFLELSTKPKEKKHNFIFGNTNRFFPRKNQFLLIQAFFNEFGNNDKVILYLNGAGDECDYEILKGQINALRAKNIILSNQAFNWEEYVQKFNSFDCFVNIAKGEGYSITPREAMALGIPCILSNNTAHINICNTDIVRAVKSNIKIPFLERRGEYAGYQFDCKIKDIQKALRDVYENYSFYLNKAKNGIEWAKSLRWQALQNKYLNLIKPKKIILGKENIITDDYLMTDSQELFNKYNDILVNNI